MWLFSTNSQAQIRSLEQQTFLDAVEFIKSGDRLQVAKLKAQLQDHPLYPQLLYQDTLENFDRTPDLAIRQYIERYQHLALANSLHKHWLNYLGQQERWDLLIKYPQTDLSLLEQCYFTRAQLEYQSIDIESLQKVWLKQLKLPSACQPIEDQLISLGELPGWLIWQKIDQAMQRDQLSVAQSLMPYLSRTDQQALNHWIDYYRNPQKLILQLPNQASAFINRKIFLQALERLANSQPEAAIKLLVLHQQRYRIHPDEQHKIQRIISLRYAYRNAPEARTHLNSLHQTSGDKDTLRWQAQIALRQSDWPHLLTTIDLMPEDEQNQPKWRYWTARALDKQQAPDAAKSIYQSLAQQRHYYGFLAADQLGQNYQLHHTQPSSQLSLKQLHQKYPALALIRDLLSINWSINAHREWQHLIRHAEVQDIQAIAQVANEWQEHNFAIRALAQAKQWDQLELRFPTPYKEPVMQNASKNNIEAAWIYSIMRRESAYQTHARSSAGAVGLMQLMPGTAQYVGKKLGYSRQQYRNLLDAQSNIELGSAYLAYLLARYNGHLVMATAAYNAGPKRVDHWIKGHHNLAADQWVDSIPFSETRKYVKAIMEYKVVFETLLDQPTQKLQTLMPPIHSPGDHQALLD
ncbi:MAG: transglycosylase SLT domain-containing protein [Thiomicrospira sp.]|uniref:transglycosylase SLT domain-containing protein n=1 Tax=Thiomicrospira sp. TaxID=935 RepID=UPI0019F2DAA3|nr:transglycosylase SLT domain-containing protein [Thiomicrospira sp.]MBE0494555.1 transglycosylase SLT domain-containing protein [Thiomicrospira sp.]